VAIKIEEEWNSTPVIARVALLKSVVDDVKSEVGRYGAAQWDRVPPAYQKLLLPLFMPADTDSADRSVKDGWSGGKPVYRASMAGRCVKELYLWRVGAGAEFDRTKGNDPYRDKGELGAQEGTLHETWMVDNLRNEGFDVTKAGEGDQDELEVRYKRFVVRAHPDGLIRGLELGADTRVLECKALNQDRFSLWKTGGWDQFHNYAYQMSLEMYLASRKYGTDTKGFFVVKNRNTGETLRTLVERPPIDPATIINKFSAIEDLIEAGNATPYCPPEAEWWWCPFLGGGHCDAAKRTSDGTSVPVVDDPSFVALLTKFKRVKSDKKELEAEEAALRSLVVERMVVPAARVGDYFARISTRERIGFNIPGAKEWISAHDGNPADFDKKTSYEELRVTGGKVDDNTDNDAFGTE
jgi:hypothetical protein